MKRNSGAVLAVVLVVMAALYLVAGIMLVVNRQYFSDVEMLQDSVLSRQKLLKVSRELLQDIDVKLKEGDLFVWDDCDISSQPEYLWNADQEIFYQVAKLSKYCSGNVLTVRLWLKDSVSYENSIVVDYIVANDDWRDLLELEQILGNIIVHNGSWKLILNNHIFSRDFILIEDARSYELEMQRARIVDGHLEMLLVFINNVEEALRLYHLLIPIAELHFDKNMLFQYYSQYSTVEDGVKIIALNKNDELNPNWWIELSESLFEDLVVKNNAVFLSTKSVLDQKDEGIVGMYLSGSLFFNNADIGYMKNNEDERYELIDCLNAEKLLVAGKWQLGCDNYKKIRYYFAE